MPPTSACLLSSTVSRSAMFALPLLFALVFLTTPSHALLRLPAIIGSRMVLQASPGVARLWGTADAGATVSVAIAPSGGSASAVASSSGAFEIVLPPYQAGPVSFTLTLRNNITAEAIVLEDILFGDVFLCSGQSNMEMNVVMALNSTAEIQDSSNYPLLRVFSVEKAESVVPLDDVRSRNPLGWLPSSPDSIGRADWYTYFSATCYFFGRDTHRVANIPIGLVSSSWGGTLIEAWSSPEALSQCAKAREQAEEDLTDRWEDPQSQAEGSLNPNDDSALFNGMIHPLLRLGLKGAVWYQGEGNIDRPTLYACQFPALISSWRKEFSNPDLSFYFVQLAPYNAGGGLPAIRDAQTSGLGLPRVCMGTAIDLWDPFASDGEIHPRNKQAVGHRLSLCSQFYDYARPVDPFGPLPATVAVSTTGSEYVTTVTFQAATALVLRGTESCTSCCSQVPFFVQLPQGSWVRASRVGVSNRSVQIYSPSSQGQPAGVRYAWEDIPQCAVYDQAPTPLVAAPFQRAI